MGEPLRILLVEDSENDALLLVDELECGGYAPVFARVQTAEDFNRALDSNAFDLVIADHSMPHFSGLEALRLVKNRGLDLPFILVSGQIREEDAVEAMKSGAHDYLKKGRLARLVPAVQRELREAEVRRERKQAEIALRESEARYRALVERIPAITYVAALDEVSTTLYISPQVEEILGYEQAAYQADPDIWRKKVHPEDLERVLNEVASCHASNGSFACEYRMFRSDRQVVWFRDEATVLKDESGRPLYLQGVMFDITTRKETEEALLRARADLEVRVEQRTVELARANDELRTEIAEKMRVEQALRDSVESLKFFGYSVIHDLKSPATGIYGLARLLHRKYGDKLDEKGRSYCDQILRASEHVASLVDLINVYIASKEAPLTFETIKVKDILRIVRDEFAPQLDIRRIKWVEFETPVEIKADRLYMVRAFRNFVDNALKYGGDQLSEIRIGCETSPDFHIISVADDGVGISGEDTERVFGLFQRDVTSKGIQGGGLGLAIVREIAERHGGHAWVEPLPERGTAFYISIAREL